MRITEHRPARSFAVGAKGKFNIQHCASIELAPNEQVTLIFNSKSEYDIVQKEWGFYATPSTNGRLLDHGLHTALVKNILTSRYYVVLVHENYYSSFFHYLSTEKMELVHWLDTDEHLESLSFLPKN